jgi:hypothetical protein
MIFGIMGMHALVQHCPAPPHALSAAATTRTAAQHAAEHLSAVATTAEPVIGILQLTEHPGDVLGDTLMLCAAMLLGAGASLALARRQRFRRPIAAPRQCLTRWRPAVAVVGTGPPSVLAFAVIRC